MKLSHIQLKEPEYQIKKMLATNHERFCSECKWHGKNAISTNDGYKCPCCGNMI